MISKKENPFINLLANVVLPVVILNKFSAQSPTLALLVALMLPTAYGTWSFIQEKRLNYISILGIVNTLFTGGFAILQLDGIWFAFKEAGFPFIIGLFVLFSSFSDKPFLKLMLVDTGALNTDLIHEKLEEKNNTAHFWELLKKSTLFFSFTFFFSSLLNFLLAYRIFTKIPESLTADQKATLLNEQIAEMTWMGYVVIFFPSIILFIAIMYYFFKKLTRMTDIPFDQIVKS